MEFVMSGEYECEGAVSSVLINRNIVIDETIQEIEDLQKEIIAGIINFVWITGED